MLPMLTLIYAEYTVNVKKKQLKFILYVGMYVYTIGLCTLCCIQPDGIQIDKTEKSFKYVDIKHSGF